MQDSREFQSRILADTNGIKEHLKTLNGTVARNSTAITQSQLDIALLKAETMHLRELRRDDIEQTRKADEKHESSLAEVAKSQAIPIGTLLMLIVNIALMFLK